MLAALRHQAVRILAPPGGRLYGSRAGVIDSEAHTTSQLFYAETAPAHARLGGIHADRIVNCWPLARLLAWLSDPSSASRR